MFFAKMRYFHILELEILKADQFTVNYFFCAKKDGLEKLTKFFFANDIRNSVCKKNLSKKKCL